MPSRCCWCQSPFIFQNTLGYDGWWCPTPACQQRQIEHGIAINGVPVYIPLPKQVDFIEAHARRKLYGGAAGGAKSHAIRWYAYRRCLTTPNFQALVLRRTFPELESTHMRRAAEEAPRFGASVVLSARPPVVRFSNGSLLEFGHCQESANVSRYLSAEYDLIAFDELVTFEELQFLQVAARARTTKAGVTPEVIAGTNPGGPQAAWVKARFIDRVIDLAQYPEYRAEDYCYIPATLEDNPYIDATYEASLNDLPPALRDAYRHGSWDIWPGQYFSEWRRHRHVIDPHEIPTTVERFRAVDWGYLRPGVCLWFVASADGRLIVEDEYVFRETIASEVAQEIYRLTKQRGLKVRYTVADPAMWIRDGQTGESMAETFQRFKVPLIAANHERVNGWQRLRHWLRDAPDKKPWLQVFESCPYLIRTLPSLMSDDHKSEDVNTDGEDHAADALRYAVMSRPWPTRDRLVSRPAPGTMGSLKKELDRDRRRNRSRRPVYAA